MKVSNQSINKLLLSSVILVFLFTSILPIHSATLNLAKKRNYNLGKGEKLVLNLNLHKYGNFKYRSSTKGPFVFEKLNRGKIRVTFEAGLLDEKDKEIGKTYKQSFAFTKKNIGQNFYATFSATFEPGLTFKSNSKKSVDISITNRNIKEANVVLVSKKNYTSRFNFLYNEDLFIVDPEKSGFVINKGENPLTIKFKNDDNFHEEITIFGDDGDGRTDKLYVRIKRNVKKSKVSLLKALNMKSDDNETKEAANITGTKAKGAINKPKKEMELKRQNIKTPKIETNNNTGNSKNSILSLVSLILNGVFLIIIIILFIKNLVPKKDADNDKHFMFYTNAATLLDVNLKGRSFEHTMDEMVIKMIELTDGGDIAKKFKGKDYSNTAGVDLQQKINDRKENNKRKRTGGSKNEKKHSNVIQKNDDSFLLNDDRNKQTASREDVERVIANSFTEGEIADNKQQKKEDVPNFESTIDFLNEGDDIIAAASEELENKISQNSIEDRKKKLQKFMRKE